MSEGWSVPVFNWKDSVCSSVTCSKVHDPGHRAFSIRLIPFSFIYSLSRWRKLYIVRSLNHPFSQIAVAKCISYLHVVIINRIHLLVAISKPYQHIHRDIWPGRFIRIYLYRFLRSNGRRIPGRKFQTRTLHYPCAAFNTRHPIGS